MNKNKAMPILLMVVLLLLAGLPLETGGKIDPSLPRPILENKTAAPLMKGIKLTSWDGQQSLFCLQIEALQAVPKVVGPFTLVDQRDIKATNCTLKVGSAALAGSLQEIAQLVVCVARPEKRPVAQSGLAPKLIELPPKFEAAPFACTITHHDCRETLLQADLATFNPGQTQITLEGNARVSAAKHVGLAASKMVWSVTTQQLKVEGIYTWQTGGRKITGKNDSFILSDDGIRRIKAKKSPALPFPGQSPAPNANALLMVAATGGDFLPLGNVFMSQLYGELPENRTVIGELTTATQESKEPRRDQKPTVYPSPPFARSLEESAVRELLCEKSNWYYR
jgi:hypothetical protein